MFAAPRDINWNYTYSCNFNCSHCYSRAPSYPKELSEDSYSRIAWRIADAGVLFVGFGGGEPLVRKDFVQTLQFLGDHGVCTNFTTNGWLITEEIADKIQAAKVDLISVSVDSASKVLHDKIRNKNGSFHRAMSALSHLRGTCRSLSVSVTVSRANFQEVEQIVDLCISAGANEVNLKVFRPAGNGLLLKNELLLTRDQVQALAQFAQNRNKIPGVTISFFGPESQNGCSCGLRTLTLRPNGDVGICPYSGDVIGNLLNESLVDIWTKSPGLVERRSDPSRCFGIQDNIWPLGDGREESDQKYSDRVLRRWRSSDG